MSGWQQLFMRLLSRSTAGAPERGTLGASWYVPQLLRQGPERPSLAAARGCELRQQHDGVLWDSSRVRHLMGRACCEAAAWGPAWVNIRIAGTNCSAPRQTPVEQPLSGPETRNVQGPAVGFNRSYQEAR